MSHFSLEGGLEKRCDIYVWDQNDVRRTSCDCGLMGLDGLHGLEGVEDAMDDVVGEEGACMWYASW